MDSPASSDLWGPGNKNLVFKSSASAAREWIENYSPEEKSQQEQRQQILEACDSRPDVLLRSCFPGHLTASALVIDHSCEKVMLHHHAKLDRWLQFGGHCDGDGNLAHAAWRECVEESGIEDLWIYPRVIDVDIHGIPALGGEPAHDHLDIRFLVMTDPDNTPIISEESKDVRWFSFEELENVDTDHSVLRLAELAKLRNR